VVAWERGIKTASAMNISLSIQRNIGFGTVVDAGYVGSLGRHLQEWGVGDQWNGRPG
jgi:hypothetical protein